MPLISAGFIATGATAQALPRVAKRAARAAPVGVKPVGLAT